MCVCMHACVCVCVCVCVCLGVLVFLVSLVYNKRQEDFKTLREYNDYLEEIEEISKFCSRITLLPT